MATISRVAAAAAFTAGLGCAGGAPAGHAEEAPNTLTAREQADGWKLLFDGKTADGWRAFHRPAFPDKGWVVEDGALVHKARGGGGDIVTIEQFASFEFAFEWKVAEGANSGVFYHVTEDQGAVYHTGPEYQILHNQKHPDGRNPVTSAASCYAVYAPAKDLTRAPGEWNQGRLVVDGKRVEHWLNGEKAVAYEIDSDDWKAKIAASKFKEMPHFAQRDKGHLALQDHGDEVAYRSLKLRPLAAK